MIRQDKTKELDRMSPFTVFSLPSPSALLPSFQKEGLISAQHFTCPHRQRRPCEDMHAGMKAHTLRGEADMLGEWKEITGSQEQGSTDQNVAELSPASQPRRTTGQTGHKQCRAINHVAGADSGPTVPGHRGLALQQWLMRWMQPLSQNCITKEYKLPLPAGMHKRLPLSSLTATLWETADAGQD